MKPAIKRTRDFPPDAQGFLEENKVGKRLAYFFVYFLLTFAYELAYCAAYLLITGMHQSYLESTLRFVDHSANPANPGASYWLFENPYKVI